MTKSCKKRLETMLEPMPCMRIVIDNDVPLDEYGNYLINVGYLRVSTDKQAEEGYGLDVQEKDVKRYAELTEMGNLVLFIDDGWTGTTMDRPALNAITNLIDQFNSGMSKVRINSFIVPRIDRLSRTLYGALQFIQDYIICQKDSKNSHINRNKEDISFISVAEKDCCFDKDNPRNKFIFLFFASLSELDRDLIVQKLQRGRIARAESGKWSGGGNNPYGYRYDKESGKLVVINEEAERVREVFRLYIEEGMSPAKIANILGFKGERIVSQILRRKSLTGCIVTKYGEFQGEHEAIVPLERWQEAQDEIEKRRVHRGDSHHLLTGLVYCGVCGAKMRYQKWGQHTSDCKLVCYSQQPSKPHLVRNKDCDIEKHWASDIEDIVIQKIFSMTYLANDDNRKGKAHLSVTDSLTEELKKAKRQLERLYEFDDDNFDDDVLKEKIVRVRRRISEIQNMLLDAEKQAWNERKIQKAITVLKTIESTWGGMSQEEKQTVCRDLIERVNVYRNGNVDVVLTINKYLVEDL